MIRFFSYSINQSSIQLFIGFSFSVKTASLPDYTDYAMTGIFKTVTIIIWLFVISKILLMSMEWASIKTKTNSLFRKNTVPLFNNLGKIAIGIFGAYFIFLSWDININGILHLWGFGCCFRFGCKRYGFKFFCRYFFIADAPLRKAITLLETEKEDLNQMV